MTMTPDVPLSRRWTMPGRSFASDTAQILDVVKQRVDERPGRVACAGCTTMPAGLLSTATSGSW